MPKRKLFSKKDGTTFVEDVQDISEDVKAFIAGLPAKIKTILPEAEDIVHAVEDVAAAVKDGTPVDVTIKRVLEQIPGTKDEHIYEFVKSLLQKLSIQLNVALDAAQEVGPIKKYVASELVMWTANVHERYQANLAVEIAVFFMNQRSE